MMDLYRLTRDELEYELEVRGFAGISTETNLSMRRKLKDLMRNETFGELVTSDTFRPEVVEEIDICNRKVTDLEMYLNEHDVIVQNSNESRFVDSKLQHLFTRLKRLVPPNDALINSISNLNVRLRDIEKCLDEKINSDYNNEHQADNNAMPPNARIPITQRHSVPVYKWDVRFSGGKEGLSVNAFIERVEEYRISRGVSEAELYSAITDLLTGKALSWYRSVKEKIYNWSGFVNKLRENYLPYNFQKDLRKEIDEREQGADESISEFFSCMLNYFGRLQKKLTELEKVEIIHSNLDPFYIERVGLHIKQIESVDKLQEICHSLETSKSMAAKRNNSRRVNPHSGTFLEPDLVYDRNIPGSQMSRPSTSKGVRFNLNVSSITCWNCNIDGHKFTECDKPRNKSFCFRCGKLGVTKYSCDCCPKNGPSGRRMAGRRS